MQYLRYMGINQPLADNYSFFKRDIAHGCWSASSQSLILLTPQVVASTYTLITIVHLAACFLLKLSAILQALYCSFSFLTSFSRGKNHSIILFPRHGRTFFVKFLLPFQDGFILHRSLWRVDHHCQYYSLLSS